MRGRRGSPAIVVSLKSFPLDPKNPYMSGIISQVADRRMYLDAACFTKATKCD